MRNIARLVVSLSFLFLSAITFAQTGNPVVADASQPVVNTTNSSPTTPASSTDAKPSETPTTGTIEAPAQSTPPPAPMVKPFSKVGIGVKMSLLGAGVEAALPLSPRTNVRVGFNAFGYSRGFNNDGISYDGSLSFRSFESHFDWFPFGGGFHLSPGMLLYNGNKISANANVGASQSFSLGSTNYISDPTNPVTGTAKIGFNSVAPSFLLGWGNLLPRGERHFSIPFELGFIYQGTPQATLNLTGNVCDSTGVNCRSIASDSTVLSNIQSQQNKLNSDLSFFRVYPIISVGFGYKF